MPFETLNPELSAYIENLCKQGCKQVYAILKQAENNQTIKELDSFSPSEKGLIICALSDIMSVYSKGTSDKK